MIAKEALASIRAKISIESLVSKYVKLRKAGKRYKACCPFHQEKTASFTLSADRNTFHCFGCHASGDIFSFYQKIEGLQFIDAVTDLAEVAGVPMEQEPQDPAAIAEQKRAKDLLQRLYFASEVAAQFFEKSLRDAEYSELAKEILKERGISEEMVKTFRIGYAPASWDSLQKELLAKSVSPRDAEIVGLLVWPDGNRRPYDRFRHRLMFPIQDKQGRVIGFSGRILPGKEEIEEGIIPEDAGKYINSPESPLFKKSESVFGLYQAKGAMVRTERAIIVEGNFDVVSMHQHGFAEAVAPLGTAFSEEQARLIKRFARSAVILMDGDVAGANATRKMIPVIQKCGIYGRVVTDVSKWGKDPDEILRNHGSIMQEAIDGASDMIEHFIEYEQSRFGGSVPERVSFLRAIAPLLVMVKDPIERSGYIKMICDRYDATERQIEMVIRETKRSDAVDEPQREVGRGSSLSGEHKRAMLDLLSMVLQSPRLATQETLQLFSDPNLYAIAAVAMEYSGYNIVDGPAILDVAAERMKPWVASVLVQSPAEADLDALFERATSVLRYHDCRWRASELRKRSERELIDGKPEEALASMKEAQRFDGMLRTFVSKR